MKRSEAFPSQYMSKDDVQPPIILHVSNVRFESVSSGDTSEDKPVMAFQEGSAKRLVLNTTNWNVLEEAYGPESDDWTGKAVELYLDRGVMYAGKKVGGVRVRIPNGGAMAHAELTMDAAVAMAASVGKTKDDLVAEFKRLGCANFGAARPLVPEIIKSWQAAQAQDFGAEAPQDDSDIPF